MLSTTTDAIAYLDDTPYRLNEKFLLSIMELNLTIYF